ncbi:hypothetical protein [Sinorhizobium fredii]|uniref:hypothetical protein n=1 Tax=Rhizobium fredii TaxID=380 RepID=UPI00055C3E46|nr:hypothetical protein [Sinorhizobium fredii]
MSSKPSNRGLRVESRPLLVYDNRTRGARRAYRIRGGSWRDEPHAKSLGILDDGIEVLLCVNENGVAKLLALVQTSILVPNDARRGPVAKFLKIELPLTSDRDNKLVRQASANSLKLASLAMQRLGPAIKKFVAEHARAS